MNFNTAYTQLNNLLFDGTLPNCIITLNRKKGANGYFWSGIFESRNENESKICDEIALNPDTFKGRTDIDVLSTLAHEMVHCWQQHFGKPSKNGYHNKEWAKKMLEIGLTPVSRDNPGKMTGTKVTHEIDTDGKFAQIANNIDFKLDWQSVPPIKSTKKHQSAKTTYRCLCSTPIYSKPGLNIACNTCNTSFIED